MRWIRRAGILGLVIWATAIARWTWLHYLPSKAPVAVAPTQVPPGGEYLFTQTPAGALELLVELKTPDSASGIVAADELALFADVKNGRFNQWTFAEAALLASGAIERQQRRPYLDQLDALRKQVEARVADARTPPEKAKLLLDHLHSKAGPLKSYERNQASLSVILDTGKFNCVSSAVIYNIIGRRLGLDLRAVLIPDHVYTILYHDNKTYPIETTSRYGFNPDRKNRIRELEDDADEAAAVRQENDPAPREPREINEQGLVAVLYYTRGYFHGKAKRHHEALLAYFNALSLDTNLPSANRNALSELINWSVDLGKMNQYTAARDEATLAFQLAPRDKIVHQNMMYAVHQGMKHLLDAGQLAEAVAWIDVSIKRCPACADLPRLKKNLLQQQAGVLVKAREWPAAAQAFSLLADHGEVKHNLAYLTQEWIKDVNAKEGPDQALAALAMLLERFPDVPEIRTIGKEAILRLARGLVESSKYQKALEVVDRGGELLKDSAQFKEMTAYTYDKWGKNLAEQKDWEAAVDVYAQALKRYPGDEFLTTNTRFVWYKWAEGYMEKKDWKSAIGVFEKALERFPDEKDLKDHLEYCKREQQQALKSD